MLKKAKTKILCPWFLCSEAALAQAADGAFPFIFLKINLFIYLFTFGCVGSSLLRGAFYSCGEQGLLFIAVHGLLITVASLVAEHGL